MEPVDVAPFFSGIWNQLSEAENAASEISVRHYEIARRTLVIRFIGSALIRYIVPALAHLETELSETAPDLTLSCWDCASLGTDFPKAPVSKQAFTPRGEVRGLNDARFHAAFEPDGGQLSLMDVEARRAVYCTMRAGDIPRFETAEPVRAILSWFMRECGRQLIHAGAVGTPRGGVLLVGRSGAGKSNSALACLGTELRYAADDFCAVSTTGNPEAYSLYCTGKTHEKDWGLHPSLLRLSPERDPQRLEKAIYFLNETVPHQLIAHFPLKAILVLRKAQVFGIRPASPTATLSLVAPDTAKLLPGAGAEVLRCLTRLVRLVPCYEMLIGPDPRQVPRTIIQVLNEDPVRMPAWETADESYSLGLPS